MNKRGVTFFFVRLLLLFALVSLTACLDLVHKFFQVGEGDPLIFEPVEVISDALRYDGYYYTEYIAGGKHRFEVKFLYKNGLFIVEEGLSSLDLDDLDQEIAKLKFGEGENPFWIWGIYRVINNTTIEFQRWYPAARRDHLYIFQGNIESDTSFVLTNSVFVREFNHEEEDAKYFFRATDFKPDSIDINSPLIQRERPE
jgi:hypothetical protein